MISINKEVLFSSDKTEWETPKDYFNELNEEFHFTLDAAASDFNHKCDKYFTIDDNGLEQDWGGEVVFCNPPYGRKDTGLWTEKAYKESLKPNTTVCLLIPARTDRASFHDYVLGKAAEIRFIRSRLAFELGGEPILDKNGKPSKAPFPSMLVVYRSDS